MVLREFRRVIRAGGRVLVSAHEGTGEVVLDEFLGEPVPGAATFYELDELVAACSAARLDVTLAERRAPYSSESQTFRLYVAGESRGTASQSWAAAYAEASSPVGSKLTSAVSTTLAARPGAACQVQYMLVWAITLSAGGKPYSEKSSVVCASRTRTVS